MALNPPLRTGSYPNNYKELLRERRRTLQTISELSSKNTQNTSADRRDLSVKPPSSIPSPINTTRTAAEGRPKNIRRRSLPNPAPTSTLTGQPPWIQPLVVLTPDDIPALYRTEREAESQDVRAQRSITALKVPSPSPPPSNIKRRPVPPRVRRKSSPLSTVKEGEHLETPPVPTRPASCSNCNTNYVQRPVQYPNASPASNGPDRPTEGWNARREQERINREKVVLSVRLRRDREREAAGTGITMGSPTNLPSASPRPVPHVQGTPTKSSAIPRPANVTRHHTYAHLPRNFYANGDCERSRESIDQRVSLAHRQAKNEVTRRASAGDGLQQMRGPRSRAAAHRHSFHQTAIDPSWTSYNEQMNQQAISRQHSRSRSMSNPTNPNQGQQYAMHQRAQSGGGYHMSSSPPETGYASSTYSNKSSASHNGRARPHPHRTPSRVSLPNGIKMERKDSGSRVGGGNFPTLSGTRPQGPQRRSSGPQTPVQQRPQPQRGTTRTSYSSQYSFSQPSRPQSLNLLQPPLQSPTHTHTPSTTSTSTTTSTTLTTPTTPPPPDILMVENPSKQSMRLASPHEQEALKLWQAEKLAEKEREDEEREQKELVRERKKKGVKGFFCGLFGKKKKNEGKEE
ncbi:hypothetical protein P280DRAFT_151397 [Massarina eburnea CBS 473.64]|uniref:Uncharacterized protein n=1 Tax=Massarina eburnea CBS 473.64 TaxID=1395130 RepID=A0A6A6RMR7_9PLEO|nr:hypothetical protein P280DRAFT_151397 [Massarina eburnea CBS 473.64]